MFLFLGISYFYINSKKEDNLTSASYLHAGHLLSQAKWSQPFWLTNYNRGRKLLSLETKFICLFQNCVGTKLSSTLFPFGVWLRIQNFYLAKDLEVTPNLKALLLAFLLLFKWMKILVQNEETCNNIVK